MNTLVGSARGIICIILLFMGGFAILSYKDCRWRRFRIRLNLGSDVQIRLDAGFSPDIVSS